MRGDRRVPSGHRHRQVLLHRGEPPRAGRAYRDREVTASTSSAPRSCSRRASPWPRPRASRGRRM
jgi:hypothetical protein